LRAMAEAVHKTQNTVLIDKYAQETALRLGVSPDAVRAEFKKLSRGNAITLKSSDDSLESEIPPAAALSPHESWLLKLLFQHEDLVEWAATHLDPLWLQHAATRQIVDLRLQIHKQRNWTSLAAFLDQCEEAALQNLITEIIAEDRPIPNPAQQLSDVTVRLRNQFLDRQNAALLQRMSQADTSDLEKVDLLRQQQELRSRKRQPLEAAS